MLTATRCRREESSPGSVGMHKSDSEPLNKVDTGSETQTSAAPQDEGLQGLVVIAA